MKTIVYRLSRTLCAVLLTTIAFAQPASAQSDGLSLEDIVSLKRVGDVRLSPKGDRIAYLLSVPRTLYEDEDGRAYYELHVVDLNGVSRPYVSGEVEISAIAWSVDGESIYFLAVRDPEATFNSLFEIPVAGGEAVELFTHVNSINSIYPAPDGKSIAFLAPDAPPEKQEELGLKGFKAVVYEESIPETKVWTLDLETNEANLQDLAGSASALAWAPDGRRYAVALASTPLIDDSFTSRDVHIVDSDSGKVLSRVGSVGKLGRFEFSPDGERIAYIGSVDINDPSEGRLYVVSASGGGRRDLVPEYAGHVGDFAWRDNTHIRWMGGRGLWTEWATASVSATNPQGAAPASGPILRAVDTRAGQTIAAAIADTPEHPPEVYLLRDDEAPNELSHRWSPSRSRSRPPVPAARGARPPGR